MTPAQIEERALVVVRAMTTDCIVGAFAATDAQMDELRAQMPTTATIDPAVNNPAPSDVTDRYMELVGVRGWLMEVLDERGELALVMGEEVLPS